MSSDILLTLFPDFGKVTGTRLKCLSFYTSADVYGLNVKNKTKNYYTSVQLNRGFHVTYLSYQLCI